MLRAFKKRQTGVTLFEVLLVLFVAAFIAAAVGTIYSKVNMTFKQNQLQTNVQQLAANITATYTGSAGPNYSSLDTKVVISGGLAPDDMHVGSNPVNPWNTNTGWDVGQGTDTSNYRITLYSIPSAACSTLYQAMNKISNASTLVINTSPVADAGAALKACNDSAGNTIILYVH